MQTLAPFRQKRVRVEWGKNRQLSIGMTPLLVLVLLITGLGAASAGAAETSPDSRTIVDLQAFRRATSIPVESPGGGEGRATLINLNPNINAWYLLRLNWGGPAPEEVYHLANARPKNQDLLLDAGTPGSVVILEGKNKYVCDLWGPKARPGFPTLRCAEKESICGILRGDIAPAWNA
jgi:hypothetical protein